MIHENLLPTITPKKLISKQYKPTKMVLQQYLLNSYVSPSS